ncbi:SDR family NAD(P)-dependent oxidoreductase [Kitasatospora sp. NPDC050467]|uniref:SDR family NAD(P)-dependent oxidoreductase n=1 Tax=Kitasatospora sp. NPDC050467 TaxID=3364053 RepID=UPI0037B74045
MTHNDNDELEAKATAYLKGLLSQATKVPVGRVDAHRAFESFGIDSVMAMTMTAELEAVLGSLPKTLFFEFRDLHGLARHLLATHRPALLRLLGGAEEETPAPAGRPRKAVPGGAAQAKGVPGGAVPRKPLTSSRWATRFEAPAPARRPEPARAPEPAPPAGPDASRVLDIAIIGLSGRYPQARTLDEFWANLAAGRDSVTEIPADRWDHRAYFDPDKDAPGKTYSKWGGFVDGVAEFDPLFFHISPSEAELMDPQERLFLQCAYETVEDAGYTPAGLNAPSENGAVPNIGVYVGVMYEEYQLYGAQEQALGRPVALSGNPSAVANRVSYYFDFRGPSMSVDTMCSSSLSAIQLACQSIRSGVCEVALAGGVNLSVHPNKYLMLGQGKFVSSKGRCESFGKGGDGYVPGEGVGAVLLKPLARAVADGDRIHGVIRGIAVNHGGRTNGYAVPSPLAQARSITDAWQQAGVDPRAVSYIEAHGTGTALGDPIEISGLTKAFRQHTQDDRFCAIGSVKSNIGHCESAAGISGLTKVLLQMRHGKLAPSLHSAELNPHIDFDGTPFTVQQTLADWQRPVLTVDGAERELPRIAGISSFGAGGSNAHLVVEEYRAEPAAAAETGSGAPVLVVLSARSADRLAEKARRLADWIEAKGLSDADLPSLARTLQVGREAMRERLGVVVDSLPGLVARLTAFAAGEEAEGLVRGRASGDSEALARLAADERLDDALAGRDLATLLDLWVRGVTVDWTGLDDGEAPARIALPAYPFSRDRYWIDTSRTAAAVAGTPVEQAPPALVFTESWEPEALPAGPAAAPRTLVCLCADRDVQEELARAARSLDPATTLVFVTRGEAFRKTSDHSYEVDAREAGDCVRAFEEIGAQYGPVDALLNLWAPADGAGPAAYPATVHLLRAVAAAGLTVRRILQAGEFRDGTEEAYLESWLGFERSLGRVLSGVGFTAVLEDARDGDGRTAPGDWFARLLDELTAAEPASALYRGGVRHVSKVRPSTPGAGKDLLKQRGTYLVTGGLGGLGLLFAEHLARTRSARLVLTGRSPLDARREQLIARIEALGGEVLYGRADVADREAVRAVVTAAHERFGAIDGVIHAAGVAGQGSLLTSDAREFRDRLASKVDGTLVLDEVLAGEPLDFVCYFSSTSAVLGDFGSCDYAVGNRFQTAYARHRDQLVRQGSLSGATVAVNWPLWRDGGMGFADAQGAELYLASSGLRLLDREEGIALFERLLGQGSTQQLVLAGEPDRVRRLLGVDRAPAGRERPATPAVPAAPAAPATTTTAHTALVPGSEHVDLDALVLSDLETMIGETLRVPREQIHADENLSHLGFDSVNLAKLAGAMSRHFGFEVLPSVFFSHPTPQRLVAHLVAEQQEALRARYTARPERPAAAAPEVTAAPEAERAARPAPARRRSEQDGPEAIAVIGMSGRFPAARSVDELWSILERGRDVLSPVPEDRRADWSDPQAQDPERTRVGFVPGIAEFDPAFFEISPREAQSMDPRQRLLLQEAWRALEDAGYGERRLRDEQIGMFVGAEQGDYLHLTQGEGSITAQHEAIMASRLAYLLDFSGPVLAINTACSSGLAAAHQACASLRSGECDAAVVAGVNLATTSRVFAETSKAGMLSESGVCHAFDTRADGMVLGEAVAVVVLKRLSQAEADGDNVLAVIRGSGMNYDGRTNGITAPNGAAQANLYRSVYRRHGIDAGRIEHIVAHGTGTRLGDPVEVNALNEVFKERTGRAGYCALTSTKTNVGHTLAASGVVSLIALVQSLRHGVIPASLHCEQDSDYIAWKESPFYVNKAAKAWPAGAEGTRLGAVSSFGMSGTNVHMVVESHRAAGRPAPTAEAPARLLVLSAKTPESLDERIRELREALRAGDFDATRLGDAAYTLLEGRQHFAHRCALVVGDAGDALAALDAAARGEELPAVRRGEVPRDRKDRSLLDIQAQALLTELAAPGIPAAKHRDVLAALAALYCQGATPDWQKLFAGERPHLTALPGYPFSRKRYWATQQRPVAAEPVAPVAAVALTPVAPAPAAPVAPAAPAAPVKAGTAGRAKIVLQSPGVKASAPTSPVAKPRNVRLGELGRPAERPAPVASPVVADPAAVSPVAAGSAVAVQPPAAPVRSTSVLRQELRAGLAEALYLPESDIDLNRNFIELGLDSIVGVEWIKTLNKKYGTALTAARLYDYPTVREFADFLNGEMAASAPEPAPVPVPVPVVEPAPAPVAEPAPVVAGPAPVAAAQPAPVVARPVRPKSVLIDELRSSLAEALFLESGEIDAGRNFVELGMDSIIGVEWVKTINRMYGTSLTATRLYDYATLRELAGHLETQIPAPAEPAAVQPAPAPAPVAPAAPAASAEPAPAAPAAPVTPVAPAPAVSTPAVSTPAPAPAPAAREAAPPAVRTGNRAAVIGMSGRYPGAENLRQYWDNLSNGRNSVREVPPSRWDVAQYYDPRPGQKGRTTCKWLGYLEDADCFDPLFFNISPLEAEGLDPQQRLFLQEAYRAFEDAGYDPQSLSRKKCGVFLGISGNEYSFLVFRNGAETNAATSSSNAIAASRIAYFLNLKGPAIAIDTACSSSLVALHLAQQALASHEIDIALVGGVSLYLLPDTYVGMSEAGMLSPHGQCRSFDNGADGFVPGEGVGALVLKRLGDAEADHDHVYGVVAASGTNQDGKTNGITAPSANSQMELVRSVYDRHGIDAASIGYVEMHGTGTKLGDPIELDALGTVYRERGVPTGSCAIGSVKSNIGHTSAAAGVAGVHKALLSMRHGLLVPSLNFETPNEHFDFAHSPFRVNTRLEPWEPQAGRAPRRAAVSSFGFSGTNAHVVLEEYRNA